MEYYQYGILIFVTTVVLSMTKDYIEVNYYHKKKKINKKKN